MYGCDRCVSTGCLSGSVTRVGQDLSGCVSLVCSANHDLRYLRVNTDVIWLTPDMLSDDFDIYSNVVWKIETEDMDNGGEGQKIMSMLENSTYLYNEYYLKNSV